MSTASKEVWFISDTHFGHANIINFKDNDGKPIRDFATIEEHDETIVANWNAVVRPFDRVYHMGDVVINRKALPILSRCNGKKVLIKGNHDIFPLKDYTPYFEDIRAYKVYPKHGIICSHIPIYDGQFSRYPLRPGGRWKYNLHGHTHHNDVKKFDVRFHDENWQTGTLLEIPDPRYINLCVEKTGYKPVSLNQLLTNLKGEDQND